MYTYHGYGQRIEKDDAIMWDESYVTERPPNVPEDWVIYARLLPGPFASIEEAIDAGIVELEAVGEKASAGEPLWPHGIEDIEGLHGEIGVVIKYWAPPDEPPPVKVVGQKDRTGLIIGAAAVGISLVATAAYVAGKK